MVRPEQFWEEYMNELGDPSRTRSDAQHAAYQRTVGNSTCPFCGDMTPEIQERMIHEGCYWRAWHNPFPYSGHASHIMLAPIAHWTQPSDVHAEAAAEWFALVNMLISKFDLPGGGLVMRFGEHEYKGGSITHLHAHIQVPDKSTFAIAVFYEDAQLREFFKR